MSADSHANLDLISSYLSGECTPEEAAAVERWIAEHPPVRDTVETLRRSWSAVRQTPLPPLDGESEWLALAERLGLADTASVSATPSVMLRGQSFRQTASRFTPSGILSRPLFRGFPSGTMSRGLIAGVVLLFAAAVPMVWRQVAGPPDGAMMREYVTQRGQQAKITLPDGSDVILSPETHLRYSASTGTGRRVALRGQAYFTVAASTKYPFVVQAGSVTTRVLGTAFAIRAYPTDTVMQVAVTEGKVAIGREHVTTVLLPGDVGRVAPGQAPTVVRDVRMADVLGWMHGRLIFEDVPLRDVLVDVARVYDLDFRLADPAIGERLVTATFAGESAATIVERLALIADVTYVRDGRRIVWSLKP